MSKGGTHTETHLSRVRGVWFHARCTAATFRPGKPPLLSGHSKRMHAYVLKGKSEGKKRLPRPADKGNTFRNYVLVYGARIVHFVPTSQVRTVVAQHVRVFPPSTQFFGRFRYEGPYLMSADEENKRPLKENNKNNTTLV
ncbi:hypothetical protein OUZ56_007100 [Daphnia magna]|uniref:Uncharacterized protein n=1 Tax=Daphnia magna TaxID=35525 RepID=A0ABQ9YXM4_9CRUS|nr:hypothetical protein OUZ56_007100 [Daphnia magna]